MAASAASGAGKKIILITGANSGVGLGLAECLLSVPTNHILIGSRSHIKGPETVTFLRSLKLPGSAEYLHIDVASDQSIADAAQKVKMKYGRLDVLVNNAGVAIPANDADPTQPLPLREQMNRCFDVNASGPAVVVEHFKELLLAAKSWFGAAGLPNSPIPSPRIINIGSGAGSITRRLDPTSPIYKHSHIQYRASKAALSMVTANQFVELDPQGIKVFLFDPGFTQSNLSPNNTAANNARPARTSAKWIQEVVEGKREDETGRFLHNTGVYPW